LSQNIKSMDKVFLMAGAISFSAEGFDGRYKEEVKNKKQLHEAVTRWLGDEKRDDILLYGYDQKQMEADFIKSVYYLEAAGGVVFNRQKKVLFIYRSGIWDLPKGKVDEGERVKDCAIREVEEETGVKELRITDDLKSSYHIYWHNKKWYLKRTYWFFMETSSDESLKPQLEEEITEARWMNSRECREALKNTFRSLRESIGDEICRRFEELK